MANAHLLVVDDELIVRELVAAHFRSRGHQVTVAGDGAEALRALDASRTDVLIADLEMPQMDGWALLAETQKRAPLVRTIILTGHASLAFATATLEAGAFAFVTKPLDDLAPLEEQVDLALRVIGCWRRQMAALRARKP